MSKLIPVNDYFLVEVIKDGSGVNNEAWVGAPNAEEGTRLGRIVSISDFVTFWGSHTYYFDSSANNEQMNQTVHDKYKQLVGKVVYWPERSEAGTVIEHAGKEYIFMKWASVMGVLDESN